MAIKGRTATFPHNIDRTTDANARVDYEHHEVHDGSCFYYSYTAEVDAASTIDRLIITPNTAKWAHFLWAVESQALMTIKIYEDVTVESSNLVTSYNRNRNYLGTNTTEVHTPGVIGALGTLIWEWSSGTTGPKPGSSSSLLRATGELVLKKRITYLFRVTSGNDANTISEYFTWYEHTNVE